MVLSLKDKIIIEKLYVSGIDAKQISNRIDKNVETVRKHIQRNLKHLKEKHEIEKERNNTILKISKMECLREMSSLEFAKRNLSIYKANESGDLVVNKEVATNVTFDTPRKVERKIKFS